MNKSFALVVCTYLRPKPLFNLMQSVKKQTLYPNEILIIDASDDDETQSVLNNNKFSNTKYYKVNEDNKGLTKQRNYGVRLVNKSVNIICFLDDDIVLEENYFKNLISTYDEKPEVLAVGGYIINEVKWNKAEGNTRKSSFYYDGWERDEPMRFRLRKIFGLLPDTNPGFLPTFAHGRSISFLPPSGKIYEVEQLMGGVASYKKMVFDELSFSTYFKGYGLYEDADFSIRLAKKGKLYINTNAKLYHYHNKEGRPNKYKYGKMVIRNGWYVWRIKYPVPTFRAKLKWHFCALLLISIRVLNIFNSKKKIEALTESYGRIVGYFSLFIKKPK